jgi:hypothetical protein
MTLPVLRKIYDLVKSGATVTGPRPVKTPGYSGFPGSETNLEALVNDLWGDLDGISRTRRTFGKGKVIWGTPVKTILDMSGFKPDVEYSSPLDTRIDWIHRETEEADIFFIVNSSDKSFDTEIRFRVTGKEAEIWDPSTGKAIKAGYYMSDNRSVVPINLAERQSLFIVFRDKTGTTARSWDPLPSETVATITGPWELSFPSEMGAPGKITMESLESWTLNSDDGVKYFSGTATYTRKVKAEKSWLQKESEYILDLGGVGDIAEIKVNGSSAGIVWKPPYHADITGLLRKGINTLEIKVTNQWTNRLAGDMKLEAGKKVLNSPLFIRVRELNGSGLIGPVRILKRNSENRIY